MSKAYREGRENAAAHRGSAPIAEDAQVISSRKPGRSPLPNALVAWGIRLLKAALSVALLSILLRTIRMEALHQALGKADFRLLIAAFVLMPVNLAFQALRWRTLLLTEVPRVSLKRSFGSVIAGMSFGLITPGRIGEIGRVFTIPAPSRTRLAGLHILDKLYFFGAVSLSGPLMLFLMPGFSKLIPQSMRIGIGLLVSVLPFLYLSFALSPKPLKGVLVALQLTFNPKGRILELLRAFEGLRRSHCRRALGLTILQLGVIYTQFYLLSLAFQPVSWLTAAHTYAASLFVKSVLPISLGSLGVGEWAAVSFYTRYGIAETTAFSASLMIFGMNVLLPGMLGLVVLLRLKITPPKLSSIKGWGKAA